MSGHHETEPAATAASPAGGSRLRSMLAELKQIPLWMKRNPVRAGITGFVLVVLPTCLMVATMYFWPIQPPPLPTVADAWQAVEKKDFKTARRIALSLRTDTGLSYQEQSEPLYILGLAIANDAQSQWNPRERRLLYLVAAKYLQEAEQRGLPQGREAQGEQLLGRYWQLAGEAARSIAPLQAALTYKPSTETHRLLSEGYLQLLPPKPDLAKQHNEAVLADAALPAAKRHEALLRAGRIELVTGNYAAGRAALDRIPATSPLASEVALWRAQLLLDASDRLQRGASPNVAEAQSLLAEASAVLSKETQVQDKIPSITAEYLLGICLARQGRAAEAREQFAQVRRRNGQSPEQIAASLEEMELLAAEEEFQAAEELAAKILLEAEQLTDISSPWFSPAVIPERLNRLHQQLLTAGKYELALELAGNRAGIVPAWQLIQWKAQAYEARAIAAEITAQQEHRARAEATRTSARADRRQAAAEYALLGEARELSREYIDDLWNSAEQYSLGRDYRRAISATQKYLQSESRKRRPEALLLLAESQLAMDQIPEAIATLTECLESYAKHPVAYRARVVAAQAYAEQGLLSEAQRLLLQNVESDELSPRSDPWRDSLFLLARLKHREGVQLEARSRAVGIDSQEPNRIANGLKNLEQSSLAFRGAIEQFTKAVDRYADSALASETRYLLADSYRQAAKWPRKQAQTITIEATRAALARQSQQDLEAAVAEYDRLIARLGSAQEVSARPQLEKTLLRNSYFAKSDCLFDLGRYEDAIKAYSAASNRYQNDPESLSAYVQIAACYRLLAKPNEARGTLTQAKAVLSRMKPELEFTSTTPYTREQWEQLLTWLASL